MSIKGTLETFNLCELLQMLAFNQKRGTLVLAGEQGPRAILLEGGSLTFLQQDEGYSKSLERLARRQGIGADGALERTLASWRDSGRGLLATLQAAGLVNGDRLLELHRAAALEQLFEAQLTAVAAFEFAEGETRGTDGAEGVPIEPLLPVDGLLLDLARMLDHWHAVAEVIPGSGDIYEGTGIAVDLSVDEDLEIGLAEDVVPLIDGYRNLHEIAEAVHVTPYAVTRIAAALLAGGGIRSVPTEDLMVRADGLLARGEAARALPLLTRCLERGDAPLELRLRLAEALEASGHADAAAAELDTFAALSGDEPAQAVFEALNRALRLRGGDFATAARVCDFYLRRRPWLQEYRSQAAQALRDLIHGATTGGRPMDAALRLKGFIDCGDAPSEDLLLLADLFAAGGARQEAAAALYERCEELRATDRTTAARQLLRRVLELDPGHADAHRRQSELEDVRKRRGHRTRIGLTLCLLLGVAAAASFAWSRYRHTSSDQIANAYEQAASAVEKAEAHAEMLIDGFVKRADRAAEANTHDRTLAEAARHLRAEVQSLMAATVPPLDAYAEEIQRAKATGNTADHERRHERLAQHRHHLNAKAKAAVDEQALRARTALTAAVKAHKEGSFEEARRLLRLARNLAFDDATSLTQATRMLALVDEYYEGYSAVEREMHSALERGDLAAAFQAGVRGVHTLLDSDLTRQLPFPIHATSEPAGAEVWLDGEDTGLRTPCRVTYSPFRKRPHVHLRLPGRTGETIALPSFDAMRRQPEETAAWTPSVHGRLAPGPRWSVVDDAGPFTALWAGGGLPIVAGRRGRTLFAAAPADGTLTPSTRLQSNADGIRLGGRMPGMVEWQVRGHRTLSVRAPGGQGWEIQSIGRIERAPILVDGRVILVDELGTLYAFDALSGAPRWRVELGGQPCQRPYASAEGILIATIQGAVYRVGSRDGATTPLARSASGPALVLPLGDGAVVLGGGRGGCRIVRADGRVEVRGDALPRIDRTPWVDAAGVAWIEEDGVHWLGRDAGSPVLVKGLAGTAVTHVGGGGGALYACTAEGRLRAIQLGQPGQALWDAPLGGQAACSPLRLENAVFVVVDGRLVAMEV